MFSDLCRRAGEAMRRGRIFGQVAVAFTCLLTIGAFWPSAASAGQVTLTYVGYLVGIPVLSLTAVVTVPVSGGEGAAIPGDGPYQISATMQTSGNLAALYPYQAQMQSSGKLLGTRPTPHHFQSMQTIWQKRESVALSYDSDGHVTIMADPLTQAAQQAVAQGYANNTMDPTSAVLALVGSFSQRNACGGTYAVFDGVRRYDIAVEQAGQANVNMLQQSFYQGPAAECHAMPRLVGGFQQNAVQSQLYPQSAKLWLARPMKNFPAVPVRIAAQNAFGEMVLDLVNMQ